MDVNGLDRIGIKEMTRVEWNLGKRDVSECETPARFDWSSSTHAIGMPLRAHALLPLLLC